MLNIDEMFIYIVIIIGLIFIIHLYHNVQPKLSPIWEGLTNSTNPKKTDTSTSANSNIGKGLNAGSVEFNQDITGLIAVNEVELNTNKYSDQYLEILNNLKELYAKKALTALLQPIPNQNSLITNIYAATNYKNGIEIIDKIIPIISSGKNSRGILDKSVSDEVNDQPKSWIPSW
jgi:hypothetical protein